MSDKKYFENVAQKWDELRQGFFSETLREKAISAANVKRGSVAVDVGAGTGFITQGLVQKGLQVIAIDQSENMLNQMKKLFEDTGAVDFRKGEAEKLPLTDESVDHVFANMLLHHVEHPLTAIREMVRVLKKSGTLVITDLSEHDFEFLRREQHDRWMGFRREDIRRWFIEVGLKQVKVEGANEDCCAQSSCGKENAEVSIFIASGKK